MLIRNASNLSIYEISNRNESDKFTLNWHWSFKMSFKYKELQDIDNLFFL